jgi:hypothetical protein
MAGPGNLIDAGVARRSAFGDRHMNLTAPGRAPAARWTRDRASGGLRGPGTGRARARAIFEALERLAQLRGSASA